MAEELLKLDIVTPIGPVARASGIEVPGVEVPGVLGELGVLPHHVPFVTPIVPGVIRFRESDESVRVAVGKGFLEVSEGGVVTVLADRAVLGSDVDTAAINGELKTVNEQLAAAKDGNPGERSRLTDEQGWLEAQLRAASN